MERGFLWLKGCGVILVGVDGRAGAELEGLGEARLEGVGAGDVHWHILRLWVPSCALIHLQRFAAGTGSCEGEGLLLAVNIGQWGLGEGVLWRRGQCELTGWAGQTWGKCS